MLIKTKLEHNTEKVHYGISEMILYILYNISYYDYLLDNVIVSFIQVRTHIEYRKIHCISWHGMITSGHGMVYTHYTVIGFMSIENC